MQNQLDQLLWRVCNQWAETGWRPNSCTCFPTEQTFRCPQVDSGDIISEVTLWWISLRTDLSPLFSIQLWATKQWAFITLWKATQQILWAGLFYLSSNRPDQFNDSEAAGVSAWLNLRRSCVGAGALCCCVFGVERLQLWVFLPRQDNAMRWRGWQDQTGKI